MKINADEHFLCIGYVNAHMHALHSLFLFQSSKCAQPASADADTVSANELDVMSEDSESEVLLTIDQLRDLQNLRSSAQISDVLQKIANIGIK